MQQKNHRGWWSDSHRVREYGCIGMVVHTPRAWGTAHDGRTSCPVSVVRLPLLVLRASHMAWYSSGALCACVRTVAACYDGTVRTHEYVAFPHITGTVTHFLWRGHASPASAVTPPTNVPYPTTSPSPATTLCLHTYTQPDNTGPVRKRIAIHIHTARLLYRRRLP